MSQPQKISLLSRLQVDKSFPEIIAVTSGKEGVGKSFLSINIAILLGQLKKKILLIDADIHPENINVMLGIRPKYSIADVLNGKVDLRQIIINSHGGIDILLASSAIPELLVMENHSIKKFKDAFSQLENEYDTIIIDTGAGINRNVIPSVLSGDKVILMVTPDPASIADAYGMIKMLRQHQAAMPLIMIINMAISENEGESIFNKMSLMVHRFMDSKINFGGTIMQDNLIVESVRQQIPLTVKNPDSLTVNTIKGIIRKTLSLPAKEVSEQSGFFSGFMLHRNFNIGDE
ncbi:MAG: AAA family ATPase [Candidatus Hatepunaea meridiana]|nr:AAA family ATPase [Candidatus Hatepunaea meridiana]